MYVCSVNLPFFCALPCPSLTVRTRRTSSTSRGRACWAYRTRGGGGFVIFFGTRRSSLVAKPALSPFFLHLWWDLTTNIGSAFLVKPAFLRSVRNFCPKDSRLFYNATFDERFVSASRLHKICSICKVCSVAVLFSIDNATFGEYTICFMDHIRTTVVIPSICAEYAAYATFVERQSTAP